MVKFQAKEPCLAWNDICKMILAQTILAKWPTPVENVPAIGDSFLQLDIEWPGAKHKAAEACCFVIFRIMHVMLTPWNSTCP